MSAHSLSSRVPSARLIAAVAAAFALVAAMLSAATAFAPAAHAQDSRPVIGGGTPIVVGSGANCTVTAAGYDRAGAAVAFTAGHCSSFIGESVTIPGVGPAGHIVARNEQLDYSVIALDTKLVRPVRQDGVVDRGPAPAAGEVVCKLGASTGFACGTTWEVRDDIIYSQVCAGHGDSGAPVMRGDRLVGMLNGGTMPPMARDIGFGSLGAVLPPCYTPIQSPLFLPAYGYTFDAQVGDATARNWPGAGFRMA